MYKIETLILSAVMVTIGLTAYEVFNICLTTQSVVYELVK